MINLINKMTSLKSLIATGILGAGLVLGGCGNNQKYKNFAEFVIKEGKLDSNGESHLHFSKDDEDYLCSYASSENVLKTSIYGEESDEHFQDGNLNGLDGYLSNFNGENLVIDVWFQSKENKKKYETLIGNIPKWYSEWSLKEDLSRSQGNYGKRFNKYNFYEDLFSIHRLK